MYDWVVDFGFGEYLMLVVVFCGGGFWDGCDDVEVCKGVEIFVESFWYFGGCGFGGGNWDVIEFDCGGVFVCVVWDCF